MLDQINDLIENIVLQHENNITNKKTQKLQDVDKLMTYDYILTRGDIIDVQKSVIFNTHNIISVKSKQSVLYFITDNRKQNIIIDPLQPNIDQITKYFNIQPEIYYGPKYNETRIWKLEMHSEYICDIDELMIMYSDNISYNSKYFLEDCDEKQSGVFRTVTVCDTLVGHCITSKYRAELHYDDEKKYTLLLQIMDNFHDKSIKLFGATAYITGGITKGTYYYINMKNVYELDTSI